MVDQMPGYRFDAIRSDHFRSLGLELRQLKNCDFGHIIHTSRIYRNAV